MKQYTESIKGKLFKYFADKLGIKKSTKGWYRSNCYWCDGNYTMGLQIEGSKVHCFKCGGKTTPIGLLMEMEKFPTYNEARKFLSIQQEYDAYNGKIERVVKRKFKKLELPAGFNLITIGDSLLAKSARAYLRKRGFNLDKLALAGVGYCDQGEYEGYIIFPYYRRGEIVYYQGRIFFGSGPKMKNPEEEDIGVGKSEILYNEDALLMYNKIYIVESITNGLTLGDNMVALSGKKASVRQLSKIFQAPCKNFVIILDPDAIAEAIDLGLKLSNIKRVKIVVLPKDKDVNDIGKKKTKNLEKKLKYQTYTDIYKMKLSKNEGAKFTHKRVRPAYSPIRGVA